jgi:hypothetical protein
MQVTYSAHLIFRDLNPLVQSPASQDNDGFPAALEPEGSLRCPQEFEIGPYLNTFKDGITSSSYLTEKGARGSVLGGGTMLQGGRSRVRFPDEVIGFFN